MTLIEVMLAVGILTIVVLGTSFYRYYSSIDSRKATMQTAAGRIGLLLSESWGGLKGSTTYDPVAHLGSALAISPPSYSGDDISAYIPAGYKPADFNLLGAYDVYIGNDLYCAILSWKDTAVGLRTLYTAVVWEPRTAIQDDGSSYMFTNRLSSPTNQHFAISTYAAY